MWPTPISGRTANLCGSVGGFSIHPQYRNASVLGELGRRVAQIMDEKEIGSLESHVYRTNTLSLAFHRRLGF